MFLYPDDIYEKLEFDKIINLTQKLCRGNRAKEILQNPRLFNHRGQVVKMLSEVLEVKNMRQDGKSLGLRAYESIDQPLFWLRKIDYVLEIEDLVKIYDQIWSIHELTQFFKSTSPKQAYPFIYEIIQQINFDPSLIKIYGKIFDEENEIKASASPELAAIYKLIKSKERELNKTFDKLAGEFSSAGYLKDSKETMRNGRRVLSVNAEHKRRVNGIIHDESSTGKTVFIEPEQVLYINNHLFELEAQKRHEIRKILKDLCNILRPFADDFEIWQRILVRLDIIQAKAQLALQYDGNMPEILENQSIDLKKAHHPLLYLLHKKLDKVVVPFDLHLNEDKRVLVISGPNAGGKSVTMKAVGLIAMMVQCGMLIPALPDSKIGLFSHMMVDIGDQQSLEDDLSTYSSRLKNMEMFLKKAGKKSLFLIDEFGSGTDPKLGGAIAEAILHELAKKRSLGVITTHYSNIKLYAYQHDALVNGAMQFNKEKLFPTYKLNVGKPGSSFAYEIAKSVGLPEKVIKSAQRNAGEGAKEIDQLLVDLQEEKRLYEKKLEENEREKRSLQKLIKSYESAFGDLEFKRKKLKMEKKEIKLQELTALQEELKTLIKELKENKKLEEAEKAIIKVKAQKAKVIDNLDDLKEEIYYNDDFDPSSLKVGDFVKLRTGGDSAEILSIKRDLASLSMGFMTLNVPLRDLVPAGVPIKMNVKKSVNTETVKNPLQLEAKLDLRGYTKQDAIDHVQAYVDNALMSTLSRLKIIHGKGTGVLRKAILRKLKEYDDIKNVYHPDNAEGGDGVTFVDF